MNIFRYIVLSSVVIILFNYICKLDSSIKERYKKEFSRYLVICFLKMKNNEDEV